MSSGRPSSGSATILKITRATRLVATGVAAFMNHVAGWVFIVCAVFITSDVLLRNFVGFSSKATTEISGYMLAFGIAWGLAHGLATRSHIRIDVLVTRLPLKSRQFLHAFALALLTGIALFVGWCAWVLVGESILFKATDTSSLSIPLVLPQGLWAIGITMLGVMAVSLLIEVICLLVAGEAEQIDKLLGPRGFEDETKEALEAVSLGKSPTHALPESKP